MYGDAGGEPGLYLFVNLAPFLQNIIFFAFFSYFVDSFETQKGGVPQVVKQVANLSCYFGYWSKFTLLQDHCLQNFNLLKKNFVNNWNNIEIKIWHLL